jgi:hypothetical protein
LKASYLLCFQYGKNGKSDKIPPVYCKSIAGEGSVGGQTGTCDDYSRADGSLRDVAGTSVPHFGTLGTGSSK